jgi:electron transfer flavoprotein alpha/beta subunit
MNKALVVTSMVGIGAAALLGVAWFLYCENVDLKEIIKRKLEEGKDAFYDVREYVNKRTGKEEA